MLDVLSFLDAHNIRYRTNGPNCAGGNCVVHCPFCGDDDPSEHLGINLKNWRWGCWRRQSHRGIRPHRLIMALLGCSYEVADSYVTGGRELSEFDRLAESFKTSQKTGSTVAGALEFPEGFRPLKPTGRGRLYVAYMLRRGFHVEDIQRLRKVYGLRYCDRGYWRGRIVFPIYMEGCLVTWTARTIYKSEDLRYLSLSEKPKEGSRQGPPALVNIKNTVWNYDELMSEKWPVIAVVEGPMDAVKVDFYGREFGVRATCLYGTGVTEQQSYLLGDLRRRCKHFLIIPDDGALFNEMELVSELRHLSPGILRVPEGVDDPGDLTRKQVRQVFQAFL